ncbi:MAG: CsgG/HfaB family protein, partial [Desulfosarcina sp.]
REALALLETAGRVVPSNDPTIEALRRSLSAKIALNDDTEHMQRIDRLIDELTRSPSDVPPSPEADRHGAHPAVVWVMDLESSGYSLQEGAPELMGTLIENRLHEKPSLRIVDRHFMDRTLSELKLGSSTLVDQQTRLRLGRLLAVRLMVTGRIVFAGAETQVSLRCIDTETSRVVAVVVAAFQSDLPLTDMARQAADQLMQQIDTEYS